MLQEFEPETSSDGFVPETDAFQAEDTAVDSESFMVASLPLHVSDDLLSSSALASLPASADHTQSVSCAPAARAPAVSARTKRARPSCLVCYKQKTNCDGNR